MPNLQHLASLALAVTVSFTQSCAEKPCTDIGWQEGLTVNVSSDEPLTEGTYRFVIEIPEQKFEVDLTLEAPANTQEGVYVSKHIDRGSWQLNASLAGSTGFGTVGEVVIGRVGKTGGGPKSLSLTALQDGVEIGALELGAIDYSKDEPNGPGCGVATTAVASILITPRE